MTTVTVCSETAITNYIPFMSVLSVLRGRVDTAKQISSMYVYKLH